MLMLILLAALLTCKVCGEEFGSRGLLTVHMSKHEQKWISNRYHLNHALMIYFNKDINLAIMKLEFNSNSPEVTNFSTFDLKNSQALTEHLNLISRKRRLPDYLEEYKDHPQKPQRSAPAPKRSAIARPSVQPPKKVTFNVEGNIMTQWL